MQLLRIQLLSELLYLLVLVFELHQFHLQAAYPLRVFVKLIFLEISEPRFRVLGQPDLIEKELVQELFQVYHVLLHLCGFANLFHSLLAHLRLVCCRPELLLPMRRHQFSASARQRFASHLLVGSEVFCVEADRGQQLLLDWLIARSSFGISLLPRIR